MYIYIYQRLLGAKDATWCFWCQSSTLETAGAQEPVHDDTREDQNVVALWSVGSTGRFPGSLQSSRSKGVHINMQKVQLPKPQSQRLHRIFQNYWCPLCPCLIQTYPNISKSKPTRAAWMISELQEECQSAHNICWPWVLGPFWSLTILLATTQSTTTEAVWDAGIECIRPKIKGAFEQESFQKSVLSEYHTTNLYLMMSTSTQNVVICRRLTLRWRCRVFAEPQSAQTVLWS